MSFVESSNQLSGWDSPGNALAEIASYQGELQAFVMELFEELGRLTEEFVIHQQLQPSGRSSNVSDELQEQIDQLAAITAELTESVSEQKKIIDCRNI